MARTLEIFTMGDIHWDERVGDYMSKNLITIDEDATMYDAVQMMLDNKIHGLLVTDDDKLKGIITSYDVLIIMEKGKSSKNTSVKEAMSSDIVYVTPEDKIITAVNKMLENDIRRLPVIDNGRLVGIITTTDIVTAFRDK